MPPMKKVLELSKTRLEGISKASRRLTEAWGEFFVKGFVVIFISCQLDVNRQVPFDDRMEFARVNDVCLTEETYVWLKDDFYSEPVYAYKRNRASAYKERLMRGLLNSEFVELTFS